MNRVQEHYDNHLGGIYEWMVGDFETAVTAVDEYWESIALQPQASGVAVDLGCGHGIQSVSLARRGFEVVALDTCRQLLDSLRQRSESLPVTIVQDDLTSFADHLQGPVDAIICMGDTITHLESPQQVESLIAAVSGALCEGGTFCVSLRDYSGDPPEGTSRFIPVRSDDRRIHTCFLEYVSADCVLVHDLVYERTEAGWEFSASAYPKLRLAPDRMVAVCESVGLYPAGDHVDRGMQFHAFRKVHEGP